MKTLLLLRHAKADAQHPSADDINRPLATRGREDAPRVGAYLRREDLVPDLVLCSEALRARQSWDLVSDQFGAAPETQHMAALYLASPARLLDLVQSVPAGVMRLMIIAHNPGIEALARALSGHGSDPEALAALARDYPSSGLAVFEFDGSEWAAAGTAGMRLIHFVTPSSGLLPAAGD